MGKTIKETLDEIQAFQAENPEQKRSGCLFAQDANGDTLKDYTIQDEIFKNCTFYTTTLINCIFTNCSFLNCDFRSTVMYNCRFINCTINNCNFSNSEFNDTCFKDCTKNNCILTNIHRSGLSKGLTKRDANVIQDNMFFEDESDEKLESQHLAFNQRIKELMTKEFPKWTADENAKEISFSLMTADNKTGIGFYADPEKNSVDSDNFWNLTLFFETEPLLTTNLNLVGMEDKDIVNQINSWKDEVLQDNGAMLINRIIEILER